MVDEEEVVVAVVEAKLGNELTEEKAAPYIDAGRTTYDIGANDRRHTTYDIGANDRRHTTYDIGANDRRHTT